MSSARGILWMGAQHGLRLLVSLLTAIVLARYLGPVLYGEYQSVISWILIFNALAAGGLQSVVIQSLATHPQPGQVLGSAWRIRLGFTALALLLGTTLPLLLGMSATLWHGVLLTTPLLIVQNADLIEYWFIARSQPRPAVLMRLAGLGAVAVLFIWGLLTQQSWYYFLVAFWSEHLVAAMGLWWLNQRSGIPWRTWQFNPSLAAELWQQAWPILLSTVFYLATMRLDVILLNVLSTPWHSGNYAAAARFAQLWAFVPLVVVNGLFPALARLRSTNSTWYHTQVGALLQMLSLGGWLIAIPLSLSANWLVPVLLGAEFSATAPLLQLQAWITLAYFVRVGMDRWLVQEKLTRYNMLFQFLTMLVNLGLNLWLIPRWGAWGSTVASLVALASGVFIFPWCFSATRTFARRSIAPALFAPILLFNPAKRTQMWHLLKL